jgi:hypothetical protein
VATLARGKRRRRRRRRRRRMPVRAHLDGVCAANSACFFSDPERYRSVIKVN